MRDAIALFAKAAEPGFVKTRLTTRLSAEEAAALHTACVLDTWTKLRALEGVQARLFSDRESEAWTALAGGERCRLQRPGDLGVRMHGAFEDLRSEGFERIVIVGSDSPTLPVDQIRQGFAVLDEERDAALGPTGDGGYYLVGCREPRDAMFLNVRWSEETTLDQTVAAFENTGYRVRLLPQWWDVDVPEDLERLRGEPLGTAVAAWFEEFGGGSTRPK